MELPPRNDDTGMLPVNASTMAPVTAARLPRAVKELFAAMSKATLTVDPVFRREHISGSLPQTKGHVCPLRAGPIKVVGWELQLKYRSTLDDVLRGVAGSGHLAVVMEATHVNDWELNDGTYVHEVAKFTEVWPLNAAGESDPDPKWAKNVWPKNCAVRSVVKVSITLAWVQKKGTGVPPGEPLFFDVAVYWPPGQKKEGTEDAHSNKSSTGPGTSLDQWDKVSSESKHDPKDWIVQPAPSTKKDWDDLLVPRHCGSRGLDQTRDIERGNIGMVAEPMRYLPPPDPRGVRFGESNRPSGTAPDALPVVTLAPFGER